MKDEEQNVNQEAGAIRCMFYMSRCRYIDCKGKEPLFRTSVIDYGGVRASP